MTSIARARWILEASWTAFAQGIFRIGYSQIGGPDTLGVSQADPRWSGDFSDLSPLVADARWSRGGGGPGEVDAGTMTATIRDPHGTYNPENPASPLYGLLGDRLHPIRLRAVTPTLGEVGVFSGFIRKLRHQPGRRKGVTVLDCVDLFYWLSEERPVIAELGPTTTGEAIGAILDGIGFLDPAGRNLGSGDPLPGFAADGELTGLQLVAGLLEAERGLFYVNGDGVAVFEDRHRRLLRASAATIADRMTRLEPGTDADVVANIVRVQREGGVLQEATDLESVNRWGGKALPTISSPHLLNDDQAEALARYIVQQTARPRSPVRDLELDSRETDLLDQILGRELGDVVTVEEGSGGTAGDFHLERLTGSLARSGRVDAVWILSRRPDVPTPLIIGYGLIGTGTLVY